MSAPAAEGDGPYWPPVPAHARREAACGAAVPEPDASAGHVLAGALRWLEEYVEWFAAPRWEEYLPRRPFRPGPLLELLGLVRLLDRSGLVPKEAALPSRALDLAARAAGEAEFGQGLRRGDELFPYHLNLIALLETLGRPQPEARAVCQALLAADAGGHTRAYRPVLSQVELRYFVDRGGFAPPAALPALDVLHCRSIAALGPDVLQMTGDETYALTHVLFYVTDFGRTRRLLGGPGEVARLREPIRVLLGVHLARGSLDLLSELLLCAGALGGRGDDDPLVREGWHALATAQRPDGAVPSPVHRPEVLSGLTGDRAAAYLFGTCYHTTLAAALAAAARERRQGAARSAPGDPRQQVPPSLPVHAPRADREEIRHWARRAAALPRTGSPDMREAWSARLGPLLALAVQARDQEVLAELLYAAGCLGRGDDALVRRASALHAARDPGPRTPGPRSG
ncbi:hypothetical protein OHA98_37295 [Streptomyces sp. NBC_00654]|uniref:DUF6895 family protein n=1 Tax=Streptomyces sp. NBC_00654 TaxID=2975799 RepID=UPI00224FCBC3|nr:hypothetical protein [Streptomyces sp. NBC_00654]MCX4970321.1 hypothetical protein [Streptomyces sp. NBC_00654]